MKIRKRSLSKDPPRKGIWASAGGPNQDGEYGVVLGEGSKIVGFIPEQRCTGPNLESLDPLQAELIERALRDLPRLKAEVNWREARHQNG